jgi:Ca-activated chloride channel family protein
LRVLMRLPVLLFVLLWAAAAWYFAPQTPTIRMDVSLVQLSVRVTDSAGRNVSGLKKEAFDLLVDDVRTPITQFQSEDAPVTAGIIVDNSASMAAKRDEVIAAAMAFAKASNPRDQIFVVHFNDRARFGLPSERPFTSSIPELEAAVSRFELGGTTALYDAIMLARTRFRSAAYDRRMFLVITDGGDNSSQASFAEVLQGVLNDGAVIFAVGVFDAADKYTNPKLLTQLAQATGGEAFFPAAISEIRPICEKVAADVRGQYTIGFRGDEDGKYHRVRVTASGPGAGELTVRTREGYFAAARP